MNHCVAVTPGWLASRLTASRGVVWICCHSSRPLYLLLHRGVSGISGLLAFKHSSMFPVEAVETAGLD